MHGAGGATQDPRGCTACGGNQHSPAFRYDKTLTRGTGKGFVFQSNRRAWREDRRAGSVRLIGVILSG